MPKLKPTASDKAADILRRNIAAVGAYHSNYRPEAFVLVHVSFSFPTSPNARGCPEPWR